MKILLTQHFKRKFNKCDTEYQMHNRILCHHCDLGCMLYCHWKPFPACMNKTVIQEVGYCSSRKCYIITHSVLHSSVCAKVRAQNNSTQLSARSVRIQSTVSTGTEHYLEELENNQSTSFRVVEDIRPLQKTTVSLSQHFGHIV